MFFGVGMLILVDSSVWIDYFKGNDPLDKMDLLIDENLVVTNDLILAELIPFIKLRNQRKLIRLIKSVKTFPLHINWDHIIRFQHTCIKAGHNGVGIPDFIIAQNAIQHACDVYSMDHHFTKMAKGYLRKPWTEQGACIVP